MQIRRFVRLPETRHGAPTTGLRYSYQACRLLFMSPSRDTSEALVTFPATEGIFCSKYPYPYCACTNRGEDTDFIS